MSKKTIGCLVMLLVLALVVTGAVYGIRALVNRNNDKPSAEESGEVMEANPAAGEETAGETIPEIDQSLTPDAAFALGNDAYEAGDYPLSEAYYRHAVNLDASSSIYRNNLGLALLQREENGEALELFSALVEEEPNTYGYWVNLLVAAHANGIPSNEIFAAKGGYDIMPQLVAASVENPFVYKKVLEAILYNAVYMDIELDGSEMDE
jgi:tetratricopeptide (TPR) repeat protein